MQWQVENGLDFELLLHVSNQVFTAIIYSVFAL